jgi:hypothetical protein
MAQWKQYAAVVTHETKAQDIEASLRKAVNAFSAATSETEKSHKEKAVRHLCERLLATRLKILNVRIGALIVAKSKRGTTDEEMAGLRAREQEIRENGIDGILREFSVTNPVSN